MGMTKKYLQICLVVIAAVLIFFALKNVPRTAQAPESVPSPVVADPKNATYTIDGHSVTLVAGVSRVPVTVESATNVVTQYFGNNATGDLNGDGKDDIAFLLTQNSGGSGTFYYIAALLSSSNGYVGTNAVFLGDRIAPQTTQIREGQLTVNYADRKQGEPMVTKPSVGISKYFIVQSGILVAQQASYQIDTSSWKTATSDGVSFLYPENLNTAYIHTVDWPPKVQILSDVFSCTAGGSEIARAGQTTSTTIYGTTYCVTKETEGAAGSTYTNYAYAFAYKGGTAILTFTTRAPQCDNYDDPQKSACKAERATFSIDPIADAMARSFK